MGSSPGEGVAAALSHRAEVFRSKLIEDFQILESISEQGKHRAPVYSSSDISSEFTPELLLPTSLLAYCRKLDSVSAI